MQNFRLLPLLILVAMLAFSVRIVDTITGFSSLSGQAAAVEPESADHASPPAEMQNADDNEDSSQATAEEPLDAPISIAEKDMAGDPEIEWRDPNDQEVGYANVRMEMFDDLAERRKGLNEKERALMAREAVLKAAEQELDRKYIELSALKEEIENLLAEQSEEEQARINSLVKVYEGMKPKDAARIFDTLDLDILVAVMSKMSERKLSPVLAAMNAERARTVTIMLAEQKKLPDLLESQ